MVEHPERLSRLVLLNTWAWKLPSFLPPFLREFRSEGLGEILILGGTSSSNRCPARWLAASPIR